MRKESAWLLLLLALVASGVLLSSCERRAPESEAEEAGESEEVPYTEALHFGENEIEVVEFDDAEGEIPEDWQVRGGGEGHWVFVRIISKEPLESAHFTLEGSGSEYELHDSSDPAVGLLVFEIPKNDHLDWDLHPPKLIIEDDSHHGAIVL